MRTLLITLSLLLFAAITLPAQSTYTRVYEIMQENCVQCHNNADPEQGLDLEGVGANMQARMNDVYGNIVSVVPANSNAASAGLTYVHPGRPDQSFLFHKVNSGLEPTIELDADMGAPMPAYGGPIMEDVEREMIRQWILFGAPETGTPVNEDNVEMYYAGQGLASFTEAPPAPDPSEGFQIKMGPFYLSPAGEPGDELEYFQKYALDLGASLDVNRVDMMISGYSHHFIIYNYNTANASNSIPAGLRLESFHQDINLVAAIQEATDLKLPEGTAFQWPSNQVLDLNSHYINYSSGLVYQAEAYVNVYTQPAGTAAQQMYTELIADVSIYIPNNGNEITETDVITSNQDEEIFLWVIGGHTHKYGTAYKAYEWVNGVSTELIYDGACAEGVPGCVSPFFDYQHIPARYFDELRPTRFNFFEGIMHEASWVNDGPTPVGFGPTSDDEMMVLILMYTLDSAGVNVSTAIEEPIASLDGVQVFPNPVQTELTVIAAEAAYPVIFELLDVTGRQVYQSQEGVTDFQVSLENLPAGVYSYRIVDEEGRRATGRVIRQ